MSLVLLVVFAVLATGIGQAQAQAPGETKTNLSDADAGTIWFNSARPLVAARSAQASSSGKSPGFVLSDGSVALVGELSFPPGHGPFPAIVLAHGCAGTGHADKTWAPLLSDWGYAVFIVDSFRPRGFTSVCDDAARLRPLQRLPDVYGALSLLSTHPKIDPARIALMGASHGGLLTLDAATRWAKDTFGAREQRGFRAFVAMYPYCSVDVSELKSIYAPLRIHSGELDNWTPARPCEQYVAALKASGHDAGIHVYAGAYHAFDDPALPLINLSGVASAAKCWWRGASILDPLTLDDPSCLGRGVTVGHSAAAMQAARGEVQAELAQLMDGR